jgi:hypothetical protein
MFAPIFIGLCISGFCLGSPDAVSTVNALAVPDAKAFHTFIVIPARQGVNAGDLIFQEYSTQVARALIAQGFEPAKDVNTVDAIVLLDWAISDPQTKLVTGSATSMEPVGVARDKVSGIVSPVNAMVSHPTTESVTVYKRSLSAKAYDAKVYRETKASKELWEVAVDSEGSTGDIRTVFPIMVAASQPYLGVNTTKPARVTMGMEDAKVKFIRGDGPAPAAKK